MTGMNTEATPVVLPGRGEGMGESLRPGHFSAVLTVILTTKKRVEIPSLADAAKAVRAHIEDPKGEWIGSGSWLRCAKAGHVYQDGKHVATVSYNGRVWSPDMKTEIR